MSVRALVLSGGGAKGAYEAGAITSLCQKQPFDIVVGTSVGAINGAFAAQHDLAALEDTWKNTRRAQRDTTAADGQACGKRF